MPLLIPAINALLPRRTANILITQQILEFREEFAFDEAFFDPKIFLRNRETGGNSAVLRSTGLGETGSPRLWRQPRILRVRRLSPRAENCPYFRGFARRNQSRRLETGAKAGFRPLSGPQSPMAVLKSADFLHPLER
jgi:hypothetical protein